MLHNKTNGDITLHVNGKLFATLDKTAAATMTASDLVVWENSMRREHYERIDGFYSVKSEGKVREVLKDDPQLAAHDTANFEQKRMEYIDV